MEGEEENHPLPLEESLDLPNKIILGDWKKKKAFQCILSDYEKIFNHRG